MKLREKSKIWFENHEISRISKGFLKIFYLLEDTEMASTSDDPGPSTSDQSKNWTDQSK